MYAKLRESGGWSSEWLVCVVACCIMQPHGGGAAYDSGLAWLKACLGDGGRGGDNFSFCYDIGCEDVYIFLLFYSGMFATAVGCYRHLFVLCGLFHAVDSIATFFGARALAFCRMAGRKRFSCCGS